MSTFSIHHVGDVNVRENFLMDLNQARWDNEVLDPYCAEFVDLAKGLDKTVADLGIGNGFTTKKLLETGARVMANDLQIERLEHLKGAVTSSELERLSFMPGDALQVGLLMIAPNLRVNEMVFSCVISALILLLDDGDSR